MTDYIDYHNKPKSLQFAIRFVINISNFLPDKIFTIFWNTSLFIIGNTVRINPTKNKSFLIQDKDNNLEILYKKRFEFYLQNINKRLDHLSNEYLLKNIEFEDKDIVIDCGANIGELNLAIKNQINNKFDFYYYGFEPAKREFAVLSRNTLNLVKEPLALSSKVEKRKFFIRGEMADSSFEDRNSKNFEWINCTTLDTYFLTSSSIKLLKLEAEGYENEVLIGAQNILNKIEYISADLGFELENNTKSSFKEVNDFLLENNFEMIFKNPRLTYLYKNKSY